MLPRQNRLKKSSYFNKVYKEGTHLKGKYGKLIYLDKSKSGKSGMAASASSNESRLHTDESRLSPDESRLTLNKDNPDSSTANSHTQIGVVVPGKLGKAHARNKAKRQIRAVFKRNFDKIPDNQIISYILWDIDFEFDQLETDIKNLINKLRTP